MISESEYEAQIKAKMEALTKETGHCIVEYMPPLPRIACSLCEGVCVWEKFPEMELSESWLRCLKCNKIYQPQRRTPEDQVKEITAIESGIMSLTHKAIAKLMGK